MKNWAIASQNHQKDKNQTPQNPDRPDLVVAPRVWRYHQYFSRFSDKKTAISDQNESKNLPSLESGLSSDAEDTDDVLLSLTEFQQLIAQKKQQGVKDTSLSILYANIGKIYQNRYQTRVQRWEYRDYLKEQALAIKYLEKAITSQKNCVKKSK